MRLSSTLAKALTLAVVSATALSGCAMMCGACTGRKCSATTSQKCGGCKGACKAKCKAKCGACGGKK